MTPSKPANTAAHNATYFMISVTFIFLLRSLWTYPVEHSDAIQTYFYAAEILRSGDWSILLTNHHTLRWAAMLPQTGLTWLLGTRYEVFFILPLLLFSVYLVMIVFSLRKILNVSQQLLLWTLLFAELNSFLTSNHYIIAGLGIFCAFAGVLALINQGNRQTLSVMLAAVFFFIAYGAHVTYLSFAAGGFLWMTFFHRNTPKAFVFAATIIFLLVLETLVFNHLSDGQLTWGRLEALATGEHIGRNSAYTPVVFSQLFTRWLALPLPHLLLCLGFITAGAWLVVQKKSGAPVPRLIECSFLLGLCFAVGVTFAVISIEPLRPMMPLRPRYLVPFFPFASIMTVYMLSILAAKLPGIIGPREEFAAVLAFTLLLLVGPTYKIDFFRSKFAAFMWKADQEYSEFSQMFVNGELLLTSKRKIAYGMIARFKNPVKTRLRESGLSAVNLSPTHLCVEQLTKSPLHLNYEDCAD
jgi:hypothetical protein